MPFYAAIIGRPLTLHDLYEHRELRPLELPNRFREALLLWDAEDLKQLLEVESSGGGEPGSFYANFSSSTLYHEKIVEVKNDFVFIENCWSAPADFLEMYSRLSSEDQLKGFAGFIEECLDKDLRLILLSDRKTSGYPLEIIPMLIRLLGSQKISASRVFIINENTEKKAVECPTITGLLNFSNESRALSILTLAIILLRPRLTLYSIATKITRIPEAVEILSSLRIPDSVEAVRKRLSRILINLEHFSLLRSHEASGRKYYFPSTLGTKIIKLLTSFSPMIELARHTCPELRDFLKKLGSEGINIESEGGV